MKFLLVTVIFVSSIHASIFEIRNKANSWMIEAHEQTTSEIDEENFNLIIQRGVSLYLGMAQEQNRNLVVRVQDWKNPYFSAWARYEESGDLYTINFWGGFARLPGMTKRAFALTVCHELGHILAQEPFHTIKDSEMMSAEGQSDFFASSQCLKKYHYNFPFDSETELSPYAAAKCLEKFPSDELQQDFCFQSAKAGHDISRPLSQLGTTNLPEFETPQTIIVERTLNNSYPDIQCRLDTYLAGAMTSYDIELNQIVDSQEMRPKCWYKHEKTTNDATQID